MGVMDRTVDEGLRGKDPRDPQGLRLSIRTGVMTSDLL